MQPSPFAFVAASIPSPSFNTIELGPLNLRLYGLSIAVGAIVAVTIASKRWAARGGNPDDVGSIALWAIPAGVIGARLYHVATDWKTYRNDWGAALNITQGGLGIPGGIALGVIVGLVVVKRNKLPALTMLDVAAPAIPVAQAIGRLGNWFNQELYGRPTDLPWGLEIDNPVRPDGTAYPAGMTFHPTFAYEALWNLALAGGLVLLDRRKKLHPGELFTLYVLGYAVGRLWVESLRADHASLLLGVRVNIWMSVAAIVVAAAVFARNRTRSTPGGEVLAVSPDEAEAAAEPAEGDGDGAVAAAPVSLGGRPAPTPAQAPTADASGDPTGDASTDVAEDDQPDD